MSITNSRSFSLEKARAIFLSRLGIEIIIGASLAILFSSVLYFYIQLKDQAELDESSRQELQDYLIELFEKNKELESQIKVLNAAKKELEEKNIENQAALTNNQEKIKSLEEEKAELTKQLDSLRLMQSLIDYDPSNEQNKLENIEKKLNDLATSLGKQDDVGFKEKNLQEKKDFLYKIINDKVTNITNVLTSAGILKEDEFIFKRDSQGKLVSDSNWQQTLGFRIDDLNDKINALKEYNEAFKENETDKLSEKVKELNENQNKLIEIFDQNAGVIFDNFSLLGILKYLESKRIANKERIDEITYNILRKSKIDFFKNLSLEKKISLMKIIFPSEKSQEELSKFNLNKDGENDKFNNSILKNNKNTEIIANSALFYPTLDSKFQNILSDDEKTALNEIPQKNKQEFLTVFNDREKLKIIEFLYNEIQKNSQLFEYFSIDKFNEVIQDNQKIDKIILKNLDLLKDFFGAEIAAINKTNSYPESINSQKKEKYTSYLDFLKSIKPENINSFFIGRKINILKDFIESNKELNSRFEMSDLNQIQEKLGLLNKLNEIIIKHNNFLEISSYLFPKDLENLAHLNDQDKRDDFIKKNINKITIENKIKIITNYLDKINQLKNDVKEKIQSLKSVSNETISNEAAIEILQFLMDLIRGSKINQEVKTDFELSDTPEQASQSNQQEGHNASSNPK